MLALYLINSIPLSISQITHTRPSILDTQCQIQLAFVETHTHFNGLPICPSMQFNKNQNASTFKNVKDVAFYEL